MISVMDHGGGLVFSFKLKKKSNWYLNFFRFELDDKVHGISTLESKKTGDCSGWLILYGQLFLFSFSTAMITPEGKKVVLMKK